MGKRFVAAISLLASAGSLGMLLPVGITAQDGPVVTTTVLVLPVTPVPVAPGQPAVGSSEAATPDLQGLKKATPTAGIINAVCNVTLNIVGCGFFPDEVSLGCDSDGDGTVDLIIPLTDIRIVNRLLFRATLAPNTQQLPGTPFPLNCCGGIATLTLTRRIGLLTQSLNIEIDLGLRSPVLLSVTPTTFDCSSAQNLLLPGACFLTPAGLPNVTKVFAVDRSNPQNIVEAARFSILSSGLIDADFSFGAANAGKTFLFFVEGPNGRSRNLTSLPQGAASSCPLGNEAGVQVRVNCTAPPAVPSSAPLITDCVLGRTESGKLVLTVTGINIQPNAVVTINGGRAKKTRFRDLDLASNRFRSIDLIGKFCGLLPGPIVIMNPDGEPSPPFQCGHTCSGQ